MIQGLAEPAGPGWGWEGDGEDDWDSAVLTLLALAVVAATALALRWFGSGQDPEAAGPASTGPLAQALAGRAGPALPPKSEVSGGLEGQNSGQGEPDLPGYGQGNSPTAGTQDPQPPGSGDLAAIAAPAPETVGEVARGGALGQRHGDAAPEAPQGKGGERLRPGAALLGKRQAGGTSAPVLIHFTPRSLSEQVGGRVEAGGVPDEARAHLAQVRTVEQYASSWQQGAGPPGFLGRGPGGRRWRVDDSSGARTCRPPKLEPLRLGAVVSVWDAVDAAGSLSAGSQRPPDPQELPPSDTVQTGPLTDVSETGHGKSGPRAAPLLALDPGAKAGESTEAGSWAPRERHGSPVSVEGWPWVRREVLVRSFGQAPGSVGPRPEGQQWGRPLLSQGQETTAACIVGKAGVSGSGEHFLLGSGSGRPENQVGHSGGAGGGSQGLPSSGQMAGSLDTGEPAADELSCAPSPPISN